MENDIMATLKDAPSLEDIAIKHGVTVADLEKELEIGVKVESEHTPDPKIARVIATQQIAEDATFYTKGKFHNASSWPKSFKARHLEPGLVRYENIGDIDEKTGRRKDMMLLLRKEAIDRMRNTAKGKPVVNMNHKSVAPTDFKKGKADGIITGSEYNASDGWDWMEILVWDEETKKNCENGFQVSCAYKPTDIDKTPGIYHNIPYDGEILNGEYEHLAILPNPRYEKSMIICNSLGGTMKKLMMKFLNALGVAQTVELDEKTEVELEGNKVPLLELVNSFKAEKAAKEKVALENSIKELKDDSLVSIDGEEVTVKDLKAAHLAQLKNAAELKNAEETAKKEAEEKAEKEKKDAEALKNAEDEKTKKEQAEKEAEALKNAKEASDKAEAEKAAVEAAEKAKGEQHFHDLKNAAEKGGEIVKLPAYVSQEERLARGKEMWGKEPAAK